MKTKTLDHDVGIAADNETGDEGDGSAASIDESMAPVDGTPDQTIEAEPDTSDDARHDGASATDPARERTPLPAAATMSAADRDKLFRQLVDAHQKRLYRFILRNVGNSTDAEDLAQQAFAEAVRSFVTFRGESELSTWLYGIAMNLVRNFLSRSPHRLYHFETDEGLADTEHNSRSPAEQVESDQVLTRLQAELQELPKDMREVLLLVAVEDFSYEDAASMLSIPIGTVRSRVARARLALRNRMSRAGITFEF